MGILSWLMINDLFGKKTVSSHQDPETPNIWPPQNISGKELIRWQGPSRVYLKGVQPFKAGAVFLLSALFLAFLSMAFDWATSIVVAGTLTFLGLYLLLPAGQIEMIITDKGVSNGKIFLPWELIHEYWLEKRLDNDVAVLDTFSSYRKITLVLDKDQVTKIDETLGSYLMRSSKKSPENYFLDLVSLVLK